MARRRLLPHNKDSHFITAPLYHADILYSLVTRGYFTELIGGPTRVSTLKEWTLTQRADLTALIPSRFLSAEFEQQGITTRVLCSADFPVKLRYNKRTDPASPRDVFCGSNSRRGWNPGHVCSAQETPSGWCVFCRASGSHPLPSGWVLSSVVLDVVVGGSAADVDDVSQ